MQQPLPRCLIQQPGSDLEKQSQFSATSVKRNVPGERGCANKCEESIRSIRGTRWPSEGCGDVSSRQPTLEAEAAAA